MAGQNGYVEYLIQNKDSAKKLRDIENEIIEVIADGQRVVVRNDSDYAVAATSVVETVKRRLRDAGTTVFQANKLDYEPVLTPENENEPLAKRKTHHYKIRLSMILSKDPIPDAAGATLQEYRPKERKQ